MTQVYIIAQKPPNLHRPSENEQRALTQMVPSSFAVLSAQRHGMSSGEQVELATAEAMQGIFGVSHQFAAALDMYKAQWMETGRTAHGGSLAMMMLALDFGDGEGDGEDAAGPPVLGPAVTEGRSPGAPARMAQNGNRIISQSINQSINQCMALMASRANVASGNMDGSLMHPQGSQIATLAYGTGNF